MNADGIFIGAGPGGAAPQRLVLARANRHGLIAGATGTGKTVTLQGLAEGFSRAGVPVFVADVKGDLAGLAMTGTPQAKVHDAFAARAAEIGDSGWAYAPSPVQLWDLFGVQGHPIRATVSEMGPLLIARLLDLNDTQEGVLTIAFHVADKDGLLLLDLDDLQAMLADCARRANELTITYGNVSKASVGTIQRALLQLRAQGGAHFFGEPAIDIADFIALDEGRGLINVLAADRLMASPKLYSTFLLWLLSELFETLPEIGDLDKPKLVFFFDEAHLLFDDAPKALTDTIEQVVRLIRSKGVGVYFVTQNPIDIPEDVAGQLGNRIQHKLNAFTPRDQRAVRAAAETFRASASVDVVSAITELKVGEALVSLLQPDGAPSPVERTLIRPVASRVGPLTAEERRVLIATDAIGDRYDTLVDRESAQELLTAKAAEAQAAAAEAKADAARAKRDAAQAKLDARDAARRARDAAKPGLADKMVQSAARSVASSVGRQIGGKLGGQLLRGLLGGLFKGR